MLKYVTALVGCSGLVFVATILVGGTEAMGAYLVAPVCSSYAISYCSPPEAVAAPAAAAAAVVEVEGRMSAGPEVPVMVLMAGVKVPVMPVMVKRLL